MGAFFKIPRDRSVSKGLERYRIFDAHLYPCCEEIASYHNTKEGCCENDSLLQFWQAEDVAAISYHRFVGSYSQFISMPSKLGTLLSPLSGLFEYGSPNQTHS
jgi:hypothetical protein